MNAMGDFLRSRARQRVDVFQSIHRLTAAATKSESKSAFLGRTLRGRRREAVDFSHVVHALTRAATNRRTP
jgi:hypothetical protein